jgi:uncharacterized protein (TIRG00374 family)
MVFDQARAHAFLPRGQPSPRARALPSPLDGFYDRFMGGLKFLAHGRDVLMVFVTSVVIWLLETVKYWFVMHAFEFTVSFIGLMLMNGVVNLTTTLPSAPGYIGTFEVGRACLRHWISTIVSPSGILLFCMPHCGFRSRCSALTTCGDMA